MILENDEDDIKHDKWFNLSLNIYTFVIKINKMPECESTLNFELLIKYFISPCFNFYRISVTLMIFGNYGGGSYWYFQHGKWNGKDLNNCQDR